MLHAQPLQPEKPLTSSNSFIKHSKQLKIMFDRSALQLVLTIEVSFGTHAMFYTTTIPKHLLAFKVVGNEAVFVETEANVNVWSSKASSFSMVAQHNNARKVIIMPVGQLYFCFCFFVMFFNNYQRSLFILFLVLRLEFS